MDQVFLSDVELYYQQNINKPINIIDQSEAHHIIKVMRNQPGDLIYFTDGRGSIYRTEIVSINKKNAEVKILDQFDYENKLSDIQICIPRLKVQDRLEFAIEKVVELGFTDICVFESDCCIGKKPKVDRWEKIAIAAMKQSLRAYLPEISYSQNVFSENYSGTTIFFDQNANVHLKQYLNQQTTDKLRVIIGPEGGFSEREVKIAENFIKLKLTENRLRSETAVITAASYISQSLI